MTKEAEIIAIDDEIKGLMKKAEPYMQKLHEMEPDELEWISQLVSIGYFLGYDDDKLGELEKKQAEISAKSRANE